MTIAFVLLGLVAGALSTLAGQGGGLVLILACSALVGPHAALAITAPALVFGNLHRVVLYVHFIDRAVAARMIAGAVPAALVCGFAAGTTPAWLLRGLLVLLTVASVARALGRLRFSVPRWALTPSAAIVGGLTGTSGGAGVLFAPILLCAGLSGAAYAGTLPLIALAVHMARVFAYASSGLFVVELIVPTVVLAGAILVGNTLGGRARKWLSERAATWIEYGVLVLCACVSLAGFQP